MKKIYLLFLSILFITATQAQLTGTKNIPGDYATLAAAITDLNLLGVGAGGVTLNVLAGNPQTSPAAIGATGGGYIIGGAGSLILSGAAATSAANPVIITGNGNTITAPTGASPIGHVAGNLNDAIIKLIGADWITIQGFTLAENAGNTTTAAATNNMTEWGVALLYVTATDGAQNNTIQNNTIALNRTYQNTFGIYANATHTATVVTTSASATGTAGGNSGLKIYGNAINNVNNGIVVVGPLAAADFNTGVDIGGTGGVQSNTITNYGTTGTFSGYANVSGTVNGILVRNSVGYNVSYNSITSSVGGVTAGTLNGIQAPAFSVAPTGTFTSNVNNNNISLKSGLATGAMNGINILGTSGSATSTINVNNNNFADWGHTTVAASGTIILITQTGAHLNCNINGNTFTNLAVNTTGSVTFVNHGYSMPANGTQTFNNNSIVTGFNKLGAGGTITGFTSGSSSPNGATYTVTNNNLSNITVIGATAITGIFNSDGSGTSPNRTVTGNTFNNWTGGSSAIIGMSFAYIGATSTISNNTLTNFSGTSSITGITVSSTFNGGNPLSISNNTINNFTSSGTGNTVVGIASSNTSPIVNISANIINRLSTTGATANGINITGATLTNVFKNNIYDIVSTNTTPTVNGIVAGGGTTTNVYNNFISDLRAPNANAAVPIYGINNNGGTNVGIYYNTIALGKAATLTSVGAQFGVTGIGFSSSSNATLRNNIVWIDATPVGTGTIAAVRRSAPGTAGTAPSATNFNSNNNIYFVATLTGTSPVLANLNKYLYLEGTVTTTATNGYGVEIGQADNVTLNLRNDPNFNTACGLYKTFMGSREGGTFTEDNLTASGGPAFTFVPSGTAYASNSGQVISTPSIADDYSAAVRSATPDMGALEFTGISIDATPPAITYTAILNLTCTTAPVLLATITDASGVNTTAGLAPRLYYRKGGVTVESNVFLNYPAENTSAFDGWKYVEATGTAPNFSFAIDYSLLTGSMALGDSLTYFVVAQDLAAIPNVGKNTVGFPAGFCPTSVVIPASGAAPATASLGYKIIPLSATRTDANAATAVNTGTTNATYVYATINGNAACISNVTQVDFTVSGTAPAADIASAKCYYTTTAVFSTAVPFGSAIPTPAAGGISFSGSQNLAVGANYFWLVYDIACAATAANTVNGDVTSITVNGSPVVPTGTATVANAIVASTSFSTIADGDWSNPAIWGPCGVPVISCGSTATININNAVTVTTSGNVAPNVTIGAAGSLTVSAGDLTLGCSSAAGATGASNKLLTVNGTLTVSGGTLNLNGAATFATASVFNMSAGLINVDPNDGTAGGSSTAAGGFIINTPTLNLTGGNINFLDPMYTATAGTSQTVLSYNHGSLDAATGATVLTFGGGDDQNPLNVNGFYVECNIGTGTLEIGNAVVAGGRFANQRELTSRQAATNYITKFKNLTVNVGAEITLTAGSAPFAITGNLINNGVITNAGATTASGMFFADVQYSAGVVLNPLSTGQTITGSGFFKKSTADADPTDQTGNIIGSLSVYHSITSPGVTLNMPITVTNNLRLLRGKVNTTTVNFLALGNGTSIPGNPATLTATTGTLDGFTFTPLTAAAYDGGHVVGTFNRWVTATTTTGQQGLMPVGSDTARVAQILFTIAPTTAGYLTASWTDGTGTAVVSPTLNQVGVTPPIISISTIAKWDIENLGTLTGGTYTASLNNKRANSVLDFANSVLLKRATGAVGTAWDDDGAGAPIGTHIPTTGSNTSPVIGRSGLTTFSSFAIGGGLTILPVSIEFLKGAKIAGANYLDWKITCTSAPSVTISLERSADGRSFIAIQDQNATAARCLQGFNYTDVSPLSGANYYRLKITTPDGQFRYSTIVVLLNKQKGFELISLAPNPVINSAMLTLTSAKPGKIDIAVSDIEGKIVALQNVTVIAGNNPIDMNFTNLGAGTYSITAINADGERKTIRFVKY